MRSVRQGTDYFELRYEVEECKMRMLDKYPYLPLFLGSVMREEDEDVEELIREPRQKYAEQLSSLMMQADYGALTAKEDYLLLIDMVDYTIEALLTDAYRSRSFSPERYLMEVRKHLDAMKKLL